MRMNTNIIKKTGKILTYEIVLHKVLIKILSVSLFIWLTTFGAYVKVSLPFTPVPVTLQTLSVMLSGAFLGAKLAGISQIGYLMLGYLGLPVFTGASSGQAVFCGPTGGYLVGFVFCAYIIGRIIKLRENFGWILFSFSLGSLIILALGTIWLSIYMGIDFKEAFMLGFLPFIAGDTMKVFVASYFYKIFRYRLKSL